MRFRTSIAFALALLASTASAGSIRVLSHLGSVGGGDVVLIRGDADVQFSSIVCDPAPACFPRVLFGGVPARAVSFLDENTLEVITPAHVKGMIDVTVTGIFGTVTLPGAFAFDGFGGILSRFNYEAVLIPILLGPGSTPLPGLEGSSWVSEFWVRNRSADPVELFAYGYPGCNLLCSPCCNGTSPFPALGAGTLLPFDATEPSAGKLYYVQRGGSGALTFSLRVRDVSRGAANTGTEIPIVPEANFSSEIELLNVPLEATARTALRVYGMTGLASVVTLRIFSMPDGRKIEELPLVLKAGEASNQNLVNDMPSRASYGVIYDLRAAFPSILAGHYRLNISANNATTGRFWAFASATNNVTQLFTTVTPQTVP